MAWTVFPDQEPTSDIANAQSVTGVGEGVSFRRLLPTMLVVGVIGLLVYASVLGLSFIWDDEVVVVQNQFIRGWQHVPQMFSNLANRGGGEPGGFYRPIQDVSYACDYALWGLNPTGYHVVNLVLHLMTVMLIIWVVAQIVAASTSPREGVWAAAVTGTLFAIHPGISEAVIYVSARSAIMATGFSLATLAIIIIQARTVRRNIRILCFGLGVVSYALAVGSKESAMVLPVILLVGGWWIPRVLPRRSLMVWGALLSGVVVARLVVFWPWGHSRATLSMIADASLVERIMTLPAIVGGYLTILAWPAQPHLEHHFVVTSLADPMCWGVLLILLFLAGLMNLWSKSVPSVAFFSLWCLISLLPVAQLAKPLNATIAETWLYAPSIGVIALVGVAAAAAARHKPAIVALLLITLSVPLAVRTVSRIHEWNEPLAFYLQEAERSPNSFVLANNVGVEYIRHGHLAKAGQSFQRALEIENRYSVAHNNLGVVEERSGRPDRAYTHYQQAILLGQYHLAYQNLGSLLFRLGFVRQAAQVYQHGLEVFPESPGLQNGFARASGRRLRTPAAHAVEAVR